MIAPTNTSLQEYYALRAKEYDRVYEKPERQADLRLMEAWISGIFQGRRVLEIACGTGYWTRFIAPGASTVTAVDAAEETLEIARTLVKKGSVDFRNADAYALPPSLGSFDAALASFWLSHVPLKARRPFIEALHARLEPGALVLFIDNLCVEGSSTEIAETDEDGNTYQMRLLLDGTAHRVLKNFLSFTELEALIEGLGREATYRIFQYYWSFSYRV